MKNWKELLASFGLWLLVEDISDDGDGKGDNLQLTKDGELFVSEIQQELSKAREEGYEKGKDYQARLDRELYGMSFEQIKSGDFNLKTKEDEK